MLPLLPVMVGCAWPLVFAVCWTVKFPAGVTKVCVAVFAFPPPRPTGPLIVVFTGPVNTSEGNAGPALLLLFRSLAAAAPVTVPVSASVPDIGVADGFALVLLLALLPDDEHVRRWWRARWLLLDRPAFS